jgi:hypothetical protein
MTHEINEPILERTFEFTDDEGVIKPVQLRLGKPYHQPDSSSSLKF